MTIALTARGLTIDEYGKLALYLSLVEIYNIVTLPGFNSILLKAIHLKEKSFFYTAVKSTLLASFFLGSITILVLYILRSYSDIVSEDIQNLSVLAILFVIVKTLEKSEAVLPAIKEFKSLALFNLLSSMTRFLGLALTIHFTNDLYLSIKVYITLQFCLGLFSYITISKKLKFDKTNSNHKDFIKESIQMSGINFFNTGVGQIDRLLIYSLSPLALGIYQAGISYPEKLREVSKTFIMTITNSWLTYGDDEFKKRTNKRFLTFIIFFIIGGIVLFYSPIIYIPLLLGKGYEESIPIAGYFGIIILIKTANYFLQTRDIVFEKISKHQKKIIFYRVSYLILLFLLINKYNIYGVLSAIVLSEVFYFILLSFDYIKKEHK